MRNPNMLGLIQNEVMKIASKKRFAVVAIILVVLVSMFTYAQYRDIQEQIKKQGTLDWRVELQQDIVDTQNRLASSSIQDEFRQFLEFDLKQNQYYLDNDINPNYPGAPTFIRIFFSQGLTLILPLFIIVIMADIVSGEQNDGTIKTLLSRPVRRWKILMAKWLTVLLYTSMLMALTAAVCYAISGIVLGYDGWTAPILTGFQASPSGTFSTEFVHTIPMWEYLLMADWSRLDRHGGRCDDCLDGIRARQKHGNRYRHHDGCPDFRYLVDDTWFKLDEFEISRQRQLRLNQLP